MAFRRLDWYRIGTIPHPHEELSNPITLLFTVVCGTPQPTVVVKASGVRIAPLITRLLFSKRISFRPRLARIKQSMEFRCALLQAVIRDAPPRDVREHDRISENLRAL
jgi:hypothetical protein